MKNLDTVFPFYDALTEQTRFRPGMDTVPFIIIPNDRMIPFVISREHSAGTVNDIFTDKAFDEIYSYSFGSARLINKAPLPIWADCSSHSRSASSV